MENLLRRKSAAIRQRAFRRRPAKGQNPKAFWNQILIEELETWVREQARLAPVSGENPDLFLDRLLLRYCRHYKLTRAQARAAGIRLTPRLMSQARSMEEFNPLDRGIFFSPLADEFKWALKNKKLAAAEKHILIQHFGGFTTSTYHDLNHAIFVRCLRVPKIDDRYWALIEALVVFRDIQLAHELGAAGGSLNFAGILYRDSPDDFIEGEQFPSPEQFLGIVLSTQMAVLGWPEKKVRDLLKKAGIRPNASWYRTVNRGFLDITVPKWLARFPESRGLRLPPVPRGMTAVELPSADPLALLSDPRRTGSELYRWFKKWYG